MPQLSEAGAVNAPTADGQSQPALSAPRRRRGKASRPVPGVSAFHELPDYLQDNNWIQTGYRINYSLKDTLLSLFRLHNETGNIYTHLIGFFVFLALTYVTVRSVPSPLSHANEGLEWLQRHVPDVSWTQQTGMQHWQGSSARLQTLRQQAADLLQAGTRHSRRAATAISAFGEEQLAALVGLDARARELGQPYLNGLSRGLAAALQVPWPAARWPLHVFTAGACVCLALSATCHLLGCCDFHNTQMIWRMDYAGIVVLIVTSFVPAVYYSFMCQQRLRNFYIISTSVLGLATLCVTLLSKFQAKRFRPWRAALFVALGGWGAVPALHAFFLHGSEPPMQSALHHSLVMGGTYVAGALVYATRVPERWKPGAFDLAFHSHQLFHVAVLAAALVHYRGLWVLVDWRDRQGGCMPPLPLQHLDLPMNSSAA